MHRGYIKFWRKAFDSGMHRNHKLWAAWTWILAHAAYRPHSVYCGGRRVALSPGQLLTGRSRLAAEWNMSERSVRTVLAALAADGCLTVRPSSRYSLLTVTNWELYQGREAGPASGERSGRRPAGVRQGTTGKEGEEGQQEKQMKPSAAAFPPRAAPGAREAGAVYRSGRGRRLTGAALEAFEAFWEAFAYKRGKAEAADAWLDLWPLPGGTLERVLRAARSEAGQRAALLARGRTPKMAQGWLAGRRFEDEPSGPDEASAAGVTAAPAAPRGPDPFLASLAEARRRAVPMPERLRRLARGGDVPARTAGGEGA